MQLSSKAQRLAPVEDPRTTALKIAEFSWEFFSDPDLGHLQLVFNKIPQFHIDIYEIMYSPHRLFVLSTPSEFGKTTVFQIYVLYSILYELDPFITISSRVATVAQRMLFNIVDILYEHEELKRHYGSLVLQKRDRMYMNNRTSVRLTNNTVIDAIGVGGSIRSKKFGRYRPTLGIVDDPDSVQDASSKITMFKHAAWIKRDLVPRVDRDYGRVRVAGNLIAKNCTIDILRQDKRWKSKIYKAINTDKNGNYYSLWEDRFPIKELIAERDAAIQSGIKEYHDWLIERQNELVEDSEKELHGYKLSDINFEVEWIREEHRFRHRLSINHEVILPPKDDDDFAFDVVVGLGIDPAFSVSSRADYRAFPVLAKTYIPAYRFADLQHLGNTPVEIAILLDFYYNRDSIDKNIANIFDLHRRFVFDKIACEVNGAQILMEYMIRDGGYRDEFYSNFTPKFEAIKNYGVSKKDRVLRLQPKFSRLFVSKNIKNLNYFIDEVENFNSKEDDDIHLLDAIEMIDRVLKPPKVKSYKKYSNIAIANQYRRSTRDHIKNQIMQDIMAW